MCMLSLRKMTKRWNVVLLNLHFQQNIKPEYHRCIPVDEPVRIRIDTRDALDILQWERWLYFDWCTLQQRCCQRYRPHQQNLFGANKGENEALYPPNGSSIPHRSSHCPFQCRTPKHQTPTRNIALRHDLPDMYGHTSTFPSLVVALGHQQPTCWPDCDCIVTVSTLYFIPPKAKHSIMI